MIDFAAIIDLLINLQVLFTIFLIVRLIVITIKIIIKWLKDKLWLIYTNIRSNI